MKNISILKRLLAAALTLFLLITILPTALADTEEIPFRCLTLEEMQEKFPDGKYWNGGDPDSWTDKPCTHHGNCPNGGGCGCNSFLGVSIQCMGFAEKLGYDATGFNPRKNENGWYTYKGYSNMKKALDNLKPGDIVRRNGHSMYVIGVDGENVTIADCNSQDRSCNIRWGGTVTKSNLSLNFEEVRSAPFPLALSYSDLCQRYASNGTVTVTGEAVLYSAPCTTETAEESVPVATALPDSRWQVVKLYQNTVGEYWYRTTFEGTTCYLPAGEGVFAGTAGKLTISGVSAPVDKYYGKGFPIEGVIASDTLAFTRVGAYIYLGDAVADTPHMASEDTPTGKHSYSIYGSPVDDNLTFGKLELGEYTYAVRAWVLNHHANDDQLTTEETEFLLYQSTFRVSEDTCAHSYQTVTGTEGGDSLLTYACTECDFRYTVSVYVTDYMALCTGYRSCGTVTVSGETGLYSLPCSSELRADSTLVTTAQPGSQWQVAGLYGNPQGQYWYQVYYGDTACYLFAGDGQLVLDNDHVTISSVSAPINTRSGYGFPIWGLISSRTLPLSVVGAYIYDGDGVTGTPRLECTVAPTNLKSYELHNSTIDSKLTFGKLPVGSYTYAIKASVSNHHANGNILVEEQTEFLLYQSTFAVTEDRPCEHPVFRSELTAPTCISAGLMTYTCEDCGYRYTVTVLEPGDHSYGDWTPKLQPTYTEPGQEEKTCIYCGDVVTRALPVLNDPVTRWNITLGEDIGVNLALSLEETDTVRVTVDGEETGHTLADGILTVHVAAAQLTDEIAVFVNGTALAETYCVRDYALTILEGDYDDATKALVKSLLVYGSTAQTYFEHHTDTLADQGLSVTQTAPVGKTTMEITGELENADFYGATLVHEHKTAVRFYFTGALDNLSYTLNGQTVTATAKEDKVYVELAGINPQDLTQPVTVTVTDGTRTLTITYSPMDYILRMYYRKDSTEATKALVRALYHYHQAARAYVNAE